MIQHSNIQKAFNTYIRQKNIDYLKNVYHNFSNIKTCDIEKWKAAKFNLQIL